MFIAAGFDVVWEKAEGGGDQMPTFGREVGLALSFVGPVDHQVPEAAETISDLICKAKQPKKKEGKTAVSVLFPASVVVPGNKGLVPDNKGLVPGNKQPSMQTQTLFLFLLQPLN